jgi:hypothetical protein
MKQKKQAVVLAGLAVLLLLVWYFNFSTPATTSGPVAFTADYKPMDIPDPTPHPVDATRQTEYTKSVRNIFAVYVAPPQAATRLSIFRKTTVEQPPPPPPLTLPANLKFFGYATVPVDGARRAFFTDGEEVFIVGEGETLLGRFRILKVDNANLEFEELGTGRRGTAPLEEAPPA